MSYFAALSVMKPWDIRADPDSCRFEKWMAEKAKRKAAGLPGIVDYRDETYVSVLIQSEAESS